MNNTETPRRALVTGAAGFTGRYLVPQLEADGWEVDTAESLDLTDPASIDRALQSGQPTAVVHLGAISFAAYDDSERYYQTNTVGTLNLLKSISKLQLELSHFVFASTAAVYGNQGLPLLDEQLTPTPDSDYGVSKLAAEHLVRVHSTARSTIVLRPFNYTGVGQNKQFIIPKLVSHYAERKPTIELGNTDVAREFNDVRWVAAVYVAALRFRGDHTTLNLGTGQTHSLDSVMQILQSITRHQPELVTNPAFVRANDLPSLAGDPRALNSQFELPAQYDLTDTLRWMCDGYASS